MNNLMRWDPFRELEEMEERLATWFGRAPLRRFGREEPLFGADWAPLVDIAEDEKEYLITADLPEVNKDDIKVSVDDGTLTLKGERRLEKQEKGKKFHRIERAYGSFLRSFSIPDDADGTKVSAEFKEGVLKVHLPKTAKPKPKAVEVKVS
jgi:HSP20 family protein